MTKALLLSSLLLLAASAGAYDVLLDIDLDDDPGTINDYAEGDTVTVRLVLAPTEPDEWINHIGFGLGGTCWECWQQDVPYTYGTDCELYRILEGWHGDNPLIEMSWGDINLCLGCCNGNGNGDGFHFIYEAMPAGGGFALSAPVFIAEFRAWIDRGSVFDRCPHPPSNLMTFPRIFGSADAEGNRIQIGDEFTPVQPRSWSTLKSLY
jgi:hypothetical protein